MSLPNTITNGATMTGVGSTTLPAMALTPTAANRLELVEIAITNTTTTACIYKLVRWTGGAGTPGATITNGGPHIFEDTVTGVLRHAYTVAPTTVVDLGYRFRIPGAIGAGVIRPLAAAGVGVVVSANTAWGIGLMLDSGTGQLCDVDWTWVEM